MVQRRDRGIKGDRREQGDNNRPGETDPLLRLDKEKGEEKVTPFSLLFLHCCPPHKTEMLLTSKKREDVRDVREKNKEKGGGSRAGGTEKEVDSLLCKMSWKEGRGRRTKRVRERTGGYERKSSFPSLL